jgi:putative ABC transport system permease protein
LITFARDVLHGIRLLRRSPGFTAVVLLTVALGVGATTAVFSLADWVLLRPLPGTSGYDRIVTVEVRSPEDRNVGMSSPNLHDIAAAATTLESVAGWQLQLLQIVATDGRSQQIFGEEVGGDYFAVMGVRPRLGRLLTAEETRPGSGAAVGVISSDLWRTTFGEDPGVIGRVVQVNRHPITIVGVANDGFRGAERLGRIDMWIPSPVSGALRHMTDPTTRDTRRSGIYGNWAGRLAAGVTPAAAEAEMAALLQRLAATYPEDNASLATARATAVEGVGLSRTARADLVKAVRILAVVVALVLVIACANVANMLLFRGVARRGEAAVRRALGATGGRLVRQQLAEGLVLGVSGGMCGVAVAFAIRAVFRGTRLEMIELENVPLDARVLLFALLASAATGLLFGLVPTAISRRMDLTAALRDAGARATGVRTRVRSAIATLQLALSLALLVGALLLTRTLLNYRALELGFDESVVAFTIDMAPQGYTVERRQTFEDALYDRLASTPELEHAALTLTTPFAGFYAVSRILHPEDALDTVTVVSEWVSPGYFETLATPIVQGRGIEPQDMDAGAGVRNVVVSETFARDIFGGAAALGQTIRSARADGGEMRVVGVAADKRIRSMTADPELVLYEPYDAPTRLAQYITVVIRSRLGVAESEAVLRRVVDGLDPALPFMYGERLSDKTARALSEERLFARLLLTLAGIALFLAAVGLYAVIAYSVSARTREIGIRMALGANRGDVLRLVGRETAVLAALGTGLGIAGAVAVSRLVESRLFGVQPLDAGVYLLAAAFFLLVALVATAVPTRTATRIDPVTALRHD